MKIIAIFVINSDPNFDSLDPAQVSDPKCWINGAGANKLKQGRLENISMIRRALNSPAMQITPTVELDISDQVEFDELSGNFRLKDAGTL